MWITGHVLDASGRALSGVTIEASGPCTAGRRSVVTDTRGQYVLQDLRPGSYRIRFVHAEFGSAERTTDALTSYVTTINARLLAGSR